MRLLSFKIILLCVLLPPVLYLFTTWYVERHYQRRFADEIEDVYLGDTQPLLEGSVRLQEVVRRNIDQYLQEQWIVGAGLEVGVTVAAGEGETIYPATFRTAGEEVSAADPAQVAAENFALMNSDLTVAVDTRLERASLLSLAILGGYVLLGLAVLYLHYRSASQRMVSEAQSQIKEIHRLQALEEQNTARMKALQREREKLRSEFGRLKGRLAEEQQQADSNENEWIEEIESLEKQLNENQALQDTQRQEIEALREQLQDYERQKQKTGKQKTRAEESIRKRFNSLYKTIAIHDRAISGLTELNDDFQLRAEEVIHQLNADPDKVAVKRKVFGGKGQKTVLEVVFAYKGRLYFRKEKDRIEVLAIGTKNTQQRELQFLSTL
jgi:predicted  nucleic acid-binding Zn-ribbon protein